MTLSDNEVLAYLKGRDDKELFALADGVREKNVGDTVHIRGILEFSNKCARNCAYCGLRAVNNTVTRYSMTKEEIEKASDEAYVSGYKTIVLQSGEYIPYPIDMLAEIVSYIAEKGMTVTLSIGEISKDKMKLLYDAGARRYLIKHETANEELYNRLHKDSSFEKRMRAIYDVKDIGYEVGGGFLIGLPETDERDILNDLRLVGSVPLDMCGIGTFIPCGNTPLENEKKGSAILTKRAVALTRLVLERANIPVTTSLRSIDDGTLFNYGANVIMTKLTPERYRNMYEIYPLDVVSKGIKEERAEIESLIAREGRKPL